jgi:hypothetical protein
VWGRKRIAPRCEGSNEESHVDGSSYDRSVVYAAEEAAEDDAGEILATIDQLSMQLKRQLKMTQVRWIGTNMANTRHRANTGLNSNTPSALIK